MKGQTVTGRPVFWWKSSMLLVRYCCTLSSCFSDGKTFCFSRPAPESPSITMSTIDRVVLSSPLIKIRVWSSAERTSSPCPSCVGLWQVVEPPSSPVASAPIDSSSPEKLCVSEVVWIAPSGAECDWRGCNDNFLGNSPEGWNLPLGKRGCRTQAFHLFICSSFWVGN